MNDGKTKPGVMVYFDYIRPSIKHLNDEQCGALFRAILDYAQFGKLSDLDQMTEMIFEMLMPRIDRDSERYEETKEQRRFAVYCREEKRKGNEPLTFEEWRIKTSSAIERYPTPISALSPSPASNATTILSTAKNAPGEGWRGEGKNNSEALSFPPVYQNPPESDFVKLRDSKIASVKQYGKMN